MGELQNKIDESYRSEWAISIRKAENVQVGNWLRQNEPERYQAILKAIRKQEEA